MTPGSRLLETRTYRSLIFYVVVFWIATNSVSGQTERSNIKLTLSSAETIRIDIQSSRPVKSWSFLNSYGNALNLGSRIHEFQALKVNAQIIPVRNVAPGEFRSEEAVKDFSFSVRLSAADTNEPAHVSWLTPQNGLLMFADLIPRDLDKAYFAEFRLPDTWDLETAVYQDDKNRFVVDDPMKAVFLIGRPLRTAFKTVEGMNLEFVVSGNWPFKEDRAAKSASSLLKRYFEMTGFRLPKKSVVMIAPIPSANSGVQWTAETRGSTVILLLDTRAKFKNWIPQLEVIFTHELFHLWVPNSLRLEGDYDWFFEGFTLYQALLTAQESKLISFQEYLATLSRVYDSYRSAADDLSLIEASEQRWTRSASTIYDKGMLVAFLYDLMLREESRGKSGLSDRYRQLFKEYSAKEVNGNEAIMSLLSSSSSSGDFLRSHVQNKKILNLEQSLARYGLMVDSNGSQTHLRVVENPSEAQLQVLRQLGYKR